MAPGKRQVKARRHLVCNHCHSLVDFAVSGCGKTWSETTEEGFTFQCLGCWKVDCLTAELARLTDIVKGMQSEGRVIARTTNGERTTGNMTCRKVTGEKVTVEKEGGTRGQEKREVDATVETGYNVAAAIFQNGYQMQYPVILINTSCRAIIVVCVCVSHGTPISNIQFIDSYDIYFRNLKEMVVVNTNVTKSQILRWIAWWIAISKLLYLTFNNITFRATFKHCSVYMR